MLLRILTLGFLLSISFPYAQEDYGRLRQDMVNTQLKTRDIYQKTTLDAMLKVPRHIFVPDNVKPYAYTDGPLSIGEGQTISQPYIVAFMTQALKLNRNSRVLEVGTGSGYQAAVLGEIVDSVFTIEIVEPLGKRARKTLQKLGYSNVVVRIGDGYHGWIEKSPFDAIMVTAGAEKVPEPLLEQMKDGGKMIIPVGPNRGIRQLVLLEKKGDRIKRRNMMAVRFVPFVRPED